jgi:protein N-terminal asparagine amidohydrolase
LRQNVYLPLADAETGVDESLACVPAVRDAVDELLSAPVQRLDGSCAQRVLYVAQGEVAHCLASQCDVLVSDKATTCHILALRSTSDAKKDAFCTLTHLDGTSYDECLREAVQEHRRYHGCGPLRMDVHVAGGFEDARGCSREISNWLLHLLADVAEEHPSAEVTLRTAAVTALNCAGRGGPPLVRGLALDCRSGRAFAAAVAAPELRGPAPTLRSARLWAAAHHRSKALAVIHAAGEPNAVTVRPFHYETFPNLDRLLRLPDPVLLRCTSTSPVCEEDDFCATLRQTLRYIKTVPANELFQRGAVVYKRSGETNRWVAA